MKKILGLFIALSLPLNAFAGSYVDRQLKEIKKNTKYSTPQQHVLNYEYLNKNLEKYTPINIKDPKLINLSDITPVDETSYAKKLAQDENKYKSEIYPILKKKANALSEEPAAVDFYNVYRISERLIRANNLGYMNWRIAIRKTTEDVNASATMANLVMIHTSLYDSLYTNEDALAFIIAHEMSHLILNHQQRNYELQKKLSDMVKGLQMNKAFQGDLSPESKLVGSASALYMIKKTYNEFKMMEYMADTEALILIIKAGYSPSKAMEALNFLNTLPELDQFISTHPLTKDRIKSANENLSYANPYWVDEGKKNIYESNVLSVKKSSDRVSIVISKDDNLKKYYETEDIEKHLTRLAYVSYTKGNMQDAIKYFDKLSEVSNTYIPYLYLSYANEYLYKQTKDNKYQKRAQKAIEQAYALNPNDEYVKEQKQNL